MEVQQVAVIILPQHANTGTVGAIIDRFQYARLQVLRQEPGLVEKANLKLDVGVSAKDRAKEPAWVVFLEGEKAQETVNRLGPQLREEFSMHPEEDLVLVWTENNSHCQHLERVFLEPPNLTPHVGM